MTNDQWNFIFNFNYYSRDNTAAICALGYIGFRTVGGCSYEGGRTFSVPSGPDFFGDEFVAYYSLL